jgi:molybdate transport system regulatory protein
MKTDMTGPLWLLYGGSFLLEKNVIELLRQVEQRGSITNAAKAAGISYKTAWDLVDRLNNVSSSPLVVTRTGGKHGGGCDLSDYGRKVIDLYDKNRNVFEFVVKNASGDKSDFDVIEHLTRSLVMKTSARNQFSGIIETITHGPVSAEVVLRISDQEVITAVITNGSAKDLGLEKGHSVMALVKASSVIIMAGEGKIKSSTLNNLSGIVSGIVKGAVNNEIKIKISGGKSLIASITRKSAEEMNLANGVAVTAMFNASQVILAVTE